MSMHDQYNYQGTRAMAHIYKRSFLTLILMTTFVVFTLLNEPSPTGKRAHRMYIKMEKTSGNYLVINRSIFINLPKVRIMPTSNVKNSTLNILWINKPVWCNLGPVNRYLRKECPYKNCRMTENKKYMAQMAAIVFSTQEVLNPTPPYSPTDRPREQVWVFFRMEPPAIYKMSWYHNPQWIKTMNWSWGYRLDSDIFFPYQTFNKQEKTQYRNYSEIFKNKSRDAAWVVSRCSTQSRRAMYVSKLKHLGISVDIFGKCSPNKNRLSWSEIESLMNRKYKFYLSFESSFCKDYVTEKYFHYFGFDTVVLVRGGLNYTMYFDKSAFLDTADFASIKEVAKFMKKVGENENLYTRYLREKDKYKSTSTEEEFKKSSCVLCEKLNNLDKNEKIYDNIEKYIHSNTCFSPKDIS